jgi:hypothetical protein
MKTLDANSIRIGSAYGEMNVGMNILPVFGGPRRAGHSKSARRRHWFPVDKSERHHPVTEHA